MELFDYERKNIEAVRSTLAECTVLLKKDGTFPLKEAMKIAAYGNGIRHTIKGGTGSGEVNSRYYVNIEQGLEEAGFTITTKAWLDAYDKKLAEAKAAFVKKMKQEARAAHQNVFVYAMGMPMPEPEYDIPLETGSESDVNTAIYVLSRISGEGNDRQFIKGDIKLTDAEKNTILALNEKYEKFMLVLNVGGVVDLSDVVNVKNILVLSQLGTDTGSALADILLGKANPSGKLTTTWAASDEYYRSDDFDSIDDTTYDDGVYVGYRYFDSFNKKAIYPFGFGLSYTEFDTKTVDVSAVKDEVCIKANVCNTGSVNGKEVVQAYVSVPSGELDHPYKELCGFVKTKELAPNECEEVTITFKLSDMASYDEKNAEYILEGGDYIVRVGNSSANTQAVAVITLDKKAVVTKAKNVLGDCGFKDMVCTENREEVLDENIKKLSVNADDIQTTEVKYDPEYEILPEIDKLSEDELCLVEIGAFDPNSSGLASVIGDASASVCGAAGESTTRVSGVPSMVMADGPAGLRLAREYFRDEKGVHAYGQANMIESMNDYMGGFMKLLIKLVGVGGAKPKAGTEIKSQYCTAIPIGTAVAQSFNLPLAEQYGDIVGGEMEMFGVHLWLAPALNIHRSIQCGRNFEYYSEDPLVSGKFAAAITNGVQKHKGCGTTIKHYAANNKEKNRYANDSRVSERAMREIYTKGFGICVKESQPKAVMTSYNLLNGIHTAEHRGLIEDILRAEYGYEGIVMTDWIIAMMPDKRSRNRHTVPEHVAKAGGDLFMPGSKNDLKALKKGLADGVVDIHQLKINATRVYKMAKELVK